jgi:ComF family protein
VAYGSYDGALRDLIHLLKFDQVRPVATVLGRMLADAITGLEPSLPAGVIAMVPVPLFAKKKAQRGFNQADVIARAALKQMGRPERFELVARGFGRVRDTGSQIGLSRHQRRKNLRGAFEVTDATAVIGRSILLIDDVYTTGATASECARILRRAGAGRVWVVTVGRTLRMLDAAAMVSLPDEQSRDESQESGEDRVAIRARTA